MAPVVHRSSGDLLADRRYAYAEAAWNEGDAAAAADLAGQALDLAPDFAPAHALLGRATAALGRTEEARRALERALALEPDDALGAGIDLAQLGVLPEAEAISTPYVRALFDEYARRFDRHLVKSLNYRAPDLLRDALRRASSRRFRPFRFGSALDLGCGTGLMARALADVADSVEGVDLSSRMLAAARKTKLYASLTEGDLLAFLAGREAGSADLVVAADVFVYVADLQPVHAEARRVLHRDGLFAYTVQSHGGPGFRLGADGRFAHAESHLRALAAEAGFKVVSCEAVSTRQDRGEDVPGLLLVLA
jgi:predicted TPR repeat methyltransferase